MRGLGVTTGAPPRGLKRSEGVGPLPSYRGESRGVPRVMRSQGVARGILWGADRGWVVRTAFLVLLSSFSVQDSSIEEGGAPWSWSGFSVRDLY